jgi:hypothetical protein
MTLNLTLLLLMAIYYLSASKVKDKFGIPEFHIIASFNKPDQAQSIYKERWQIESALRL